MFRRVLLGTAGVTCAVGVSVAVELHSKTWSDSHTYQTALYQYSLHKAMRLLGWWSRRQLETDCQQADKVQEELLLKMLRKREGTAFGCDHNYDQILSVDDFRTKLPLTRYPDYQRYVDRIAAGEPNVMTVDPVRLLGATSGTSGNKSLLPSTGAISSRFFLSGIGVIFDALFSERGFPSADQLQRTCKLTFQPKWVYTSAGVKVGPASSSPDDRGFSRLLPLYSSPLPAYRELCEPAALYAHALFALRDGHLGMVEANFAPMVFSLFTCLTRHHQELVRDLRGGTCQGMLQLGGSPQLVSELEAQCTPLPGRAKAVEEAFTSALQADDGSLARRLWPDLNLFLTVTTGAFEPYGHRLAQKYAKDVPVYSPLYAATEGLVGVNTDARDPDPKYTLPPRAMFYEFIPLSKVAEPEPPTLLMDQVEEGKQYELVITNLAGLVRYRMGDVVEVCSRLHKSPVVRFCYRQGQVLNVRGEKMNEAVVARAVAAAAQKHDLDLVDYSTAEYVLVEEGTKGPRYHVYVETSGGNTLTSVQQASFDQELREASAVYESFRAKGSIQPAAVHSVSSGGFETFRRETLDNNATGSATQLKVPRVLRTRESVERLRRHALD